MLIRSSLLHQQDMDKPNGRRGGPLLAPAPGSGRSREQPHPPSAYQPQVRPALDADPLDWHHRPTMAKEGRCPPASTETSSSPDTLTSAAPCLLPASASSRPRTNHTTGAPGALTHMGCSGTAGIAAGEARRPIRIRCWSDQPLMRIQGAALCARPWPSLLEPCLADHPPGPGHRHLRHRGAVLTAATVRQGVVIERYRTRVSRSRTDNYFRYFRVFTISGSRSTVSSGVHERVSATSTYRGCKFLRVAVGRLSEGDNLWPSAKVVAASWTKGLMSATNVAEIVGRLQTGTLLAADY